VQKKVWEIHFHPTTLLVLYSLLLPWPQSPWTRTGLLPFL